MELALLFLIKLAIGREVAVILMQTSEIPYSEVLILTTFWYSLLAGLVWVLASRPWVIDKFDQLRDTKWGQRLTRLEAPWRTIAVVTICVVPYGFWWASMAATFWRFTAIERFIWTVVGSVASFFIYDAVWNQAETLLGTYSMEIGLTLLAALALYKKRQTARRWFVGGSQASASWFLRQYRLARTFLT